MAVNEQAFVVNLNISSDELARYYRGEAGHIITRDENGRAIQFPAVAIRPFVTRDGVQGCFEIVTDADHRLKTIRRKQT